MDIILCLFLLWFVVMMFKAINTDVNSNDYYSNSNTQCSDSSGRKIICTIGNKTVVRLKNYELDELQRKYSILDNYTNEDLKKFILDIANEYSESFFTTKDISEIFNISTQKASAILHQLCDRNFLDKGEAYLGSGKVLIYILKDNNKNDKYCEKDIIFTPAYEKYINFTPDFTISEKDKSSMHTSERNHSISIFKKENPSEEWKTEERNKMKRIYKDGLKLRDWVIVRDNYTCQKCGVSKSDEPHLLLEVDHIVPVSKWGRSTPENLQTLCWSCNRSKSDKVA